MCPAQHVCFAENCLVYVDGPDLAKKSTVWYTRDELRELKQHEIEETQNFEETLGRYCNDEAEAKQALADAGLSWRGLEYIRDGYEREDIGKEHALRVIDESYRLLYEGGRDPDKLRQFAMKSSRREQIVARKRAIRDALEVQKEEINEVIKHTAKGKPGLPRKYPTAPATLYRLKHSVMSSAA